MPNTQRGIRPGTLLAVLSVTACALLAPAAAPVARAQVRAGVVPLWAPEYSAPMVLPAQGGAVSLVAAPSGLWVTTESAVTRFSDGQWEERQQPPGAVGIFAIVPQGLDAWAFGYQGAVWQRSGGRWSALASPTGADLYAAAARAPGDVWAVGFDYGAGAGTVLQVQAGVPRAMTEPWLTQVQLYSLARAPGGELWAGGCDDEAPFLMRDGGNGAWQPVSAPLGSGCIYHLSFAGSGFGLAAAGSDVLWFDGSAWQRSGIAPPADLQWLRVAALGAGSDLAAAIPGTGWAIPALPNWRGYLKGDTPWYFDGHAWRAGQIDFGIYERAFAAGDESSNNRPFAALAGDGTTAWSVATGPNGQTGLLRLDAGTGRVLHPRLEQALDVAALPDGQVWVAGGGGTPLIGRPPGPWVDGVSEPPETLPRLQAIDLAGPRAGWALERGGGEPAAWHRVADTWQSVPVPRGLELGRVRALPDGRAWAATADGRLLAWQADQWAPLAGAPNVPIAATGSLTAPRPGTPFDVALDEGREVACVAGSDGMYRYAGGVFTRVATGAVSYGDVQLVDARHGWALPAVAAADPLAAQVARLTDCVPEPVRIPQSAGRPGLRYGPFQVLAAVGQDMLWLYRGSEGTGGPQLVGWRPGDNAPFFADVDGCAIRGLSAVPAPGGGVDVWLASPLPVPGRSANACGPVANQPIGGHPALVGRLHVDRVVRTLHLPLLGPWPGSRG